MKRIITTLLCVLLVQSCIPLRVAPTIKDYKVTKGKRFKKGLPKKNVFVFEDPKDADEFYNYINTKFQLNDYYVDVQVHFLLRTKRIIFLFTK